MSFDYAHIHFREKKFAFRYIVIISRLSGFCSWALLFHSMISFILFCSYNLSAPHFHFAIMNVEYVERKKRLSIGTNTAIKHDNDKRNKKKRIERKIEINQFHFYLNVMTFLWIPISWIVLCQPLQFSFLPFMLPHQRYKVKYLI